MSEIPGSKPKKLIKRQNFSNPTLISNHISPLFNPQTIVAFSQRQKIKNFPVQKISNSKNHHQRHNSQLSFNYDSLDVAQNLFIKNKQHSPTFRMINKINPANFQQLISNKLNNSGYKATIQSCNKSYSAKFNHIQSDSIKAKQNHGYNIISGFQSIKN